jgi:hypothetical protein
MPGRNYCIMDRYMDKRESAMRAWGVDSTSADKVELLLRPRLERRLRVPEVYDGLSLRSPFGLQGS